MTHAATAVDIGRLEAVFAHECDPDTVGREARIAAVSSCGGRPSSVARTVAVARMPHVRVSPAPWRQTRPHWGIVVGDDLFYHIIVGDGDDNDTSCALHWASQGSGMRIEPAHGVGSTTLTGDQIVDALQRVVVLFGAFREHCVIQRVRRFVLNRFSFFFRSFFFLFH